MTEGPLILAVSDATGETAAQTCRAALVQFGHFPDSTILLASHVSHEHELEPIVRKAQEMACLLAYTLVGVELRARLKMLAEDHGVPAVDLLGPLIGRLATHMGAKPKAVPGLSHVLDDDYFRRIEAVEFAVYNDDGRHPANLTRADLVIVGISRTSKTPLSNYIAHRGYKVANVPLVLDIPPPPQLEDVDPRRVFGLEIDPGVLLRIRRTRMESLGMVGDSNYGDLKHIRQEALQARRLFAAHPAWTVIDVTQKAVEETASKILEAYRAHFEPDAIQPALPPPDTVSAADRPSPGKASSPPKSTSAPKTRSARKTKAGRKKA